MRYVIQDLDEDGTWEERPGKWSTLQQAIEASCGDSTIQIVRIPCGEVVWRNPA